MGNRDRDSKPAPTRRLTARLAACAGAAGSRRRPRARAPARRSPRSRSTSSTRGSPAPATQAQALGAQIDATSAELANAQQEAIVAAQREAQLSAVLAAGEERERRLEGEVTVARGQLAAARDQLRRSLNTLSGRLVDIYRSGMPDTATLLLSGRRAGRPPDPCRVPAPDRGGRRVAGLQRARRCATRYRTGSRRSRRPSSAPRSSTSRSPPRATASPPSAPRPRLAPQQLQALRAQRQAAVESLQSQVSGWTTEVQHLRADLRPAGPGRGRPVVRRLGDPRVDRPVRVRRQFRRRQPDLGRRRRLPDPPLDLGPIRRPGRARRKPRPSSRPTSRPRSGPTPAPRPGSARAEVLG